MESLRIVLIEDDPNDRMLIQRYLRQHIHDYTVTEVATRKEFQVLMDGDYVPDVVLTDYYLGWSTGLDLIPEVRRRWSEVIVIMVTITGREEIAVEALKLGADDYILKRSDELSRLGPAVKAALEMRENRKTLRHAEQRRTLLLEILEGTPDFILTATADFKIIYFNHSARKLFEVASRPAPELLTDLYSKDDQQRFTDEALTAANDHGTWSGEGTFMLPFGQLPVYQTLIAHKETNGTTAHFTLWARDFSDRKQTEENLLTLNRTLEETNQRLVFAVEEARKRTNEAQEANRAKSDFLAVISHELRTPLNPILGFSELLLTTTPEGEQKQILTMIHQAGEQLHTLIQDVLNFSRIESRAVDIHKDWLPADAYFAELLTSYRTMATNKGIQFHATGLASLDPWMVHLDPIIIRQIIGNLLSNALKFTPKGEIEVSFSVSQPESTSGSMTIIIRDTGIGIPEDKLAHVFEPFYQVDSSSARRYGGIGLGLSISYQLVRQLNGMLHVESKETIGSAFTITLPLAFEALPKRDLIEEKPTNSKIPLQDILIVEDDATNQKVLSHFVLKYTGSTPLVVNSAEACLELLEQHKCQVILLDLHLPQIDGIACMDAITERFKQRPDAIMPYVIAVTADIRPETQRTCLEHGIKDFIGKPVDSSALQTALMHAAKRLVHGISEI